MTSPSARKGRRAELAVAEYLKAWWPTAEPTRRSGWSDDRGDIEGIPHVVIEVKSAQRHDLPGWLRELECEVNATPGAITGVLVVKRKGSTNPANWYAVTTLADWATMAKDAGL